MKRFTRSARLALLTLLLFSAGLTSCYRDVFGVEGSGPTETETRMPGNFHGVSLSIDAEVILHADSFCHAEVSAQSNILAVLKTEVHGGVLDIGFSRRVIRHRAITIHLYAPYFTSATISGSGSIRNTNALLNGNFEAGISGSGAIDLSGMQANAAKAEISGSGSIRLAGQAQSLETRTSGSGDTHAFDLLVNSGSVRISGSGNVEINASQQLHIEISGSGDVYYKGTPSMDVDISGSGQVHHVN